MSDESQKITIFYDGACASCRRDRARYEAMAGKEAQNDLCWFDISGQDDALRQLGIDPHLALTELHVRDEHQRIVSELDAYLLLMRRVTLLKPLAWLIALPLIRPLLARLYHRVVMRRLHRTNRL